MKPHELMVSKLVTDEQIQKVFANTNFGSMSHRDVIKYALLKKASIYSTGGTAKRCLIELGLINPVRGLTRKGKMYLYEAFCEGNSL